MVRTATIKKSTNRSALVAQWVRDPALVPIWLRSLLWCRFDPWPGNFHVQRARPPPPKKKVYKK